MTKCFSCQREIKDMDKIAYALHEGKSIPLHRGCLRKKMDGKLLKEVEREAKVRIQKWKRDWRLLIGEWMNRPYWEKRKGWVLCPVCPNVFCVGADSYHPALSSGVYEIGDAAFIGYLCPVCGFFLPQLPDTSDKNFDAHWKAIQECIEEENAN